MSVRLDYDYDVQALYISLAEAAVDRTVEVAPDMMVDLDAAGQLVGIEVLHYLRDWPLEEILVQYNVDEADRAQLKLLFPERAIPEKGTRLKTEAPAPICA